MCVKDVDHMIWPIGDATFLSILTAQYEGGQSIFVNPMLNNLGVGPGVSILGGLAALAIPVPFIFMRYGVKLRGMSKFTPS